MATTEIKSHLTVLMLWLWFHHQDIRPLLHFFSALDSKYVQVWWSELCVSMLKRVLLWKAFGCLHMYTHAWHMSGLFAIVLSLAFSRHPPPPPVITTLCPLFLSCFLFLSYSRPPSLFVLPLLISCACCLVRLCCRMELSWVVMWRLSQRKRAVASNLCHLILLLYRVWIDLATVRFHSVFILVLKRQSACACHIVCRGFVVYVFVI